MKKKKMRMRKLGLVVDVVGIIISAMLLAQGFINQWEINTNDVVKPIKEIIILGDVIVVNINVEVDEVEGA